MVTTEAKEATEEPGNRAPRSPERKRLSGLLFSRCAVEGLNAGQAGCRRLKGEPMNL